MLNCNHHKFLIVLIATLSAIPAIAQEALYGTFSLQPGFRREAVNGFTGGSHSLAEQFSNQDAEGNDCLGYGDTSPDFTMVLESELPQLTLQVNSGGNDTTLVVQGPDGTVRCGDDTGANEDASIAAQNWPAGSYNLWVGSFMPAQRWNYRLSAREQ